MREDMLRIRNAFANNLKHIDVDIPLGKLTVITGVSGSGKSSLAFDTIYEEGRRRYLMFSGLETETNQTYGEITGLSPTVALEQRVIRQTNVRSTVGSKSQLKVFLQSLPVNEDGVVKGIIKKAELMEEVGLSHLSLGRNVPTLSGGEVQRLVLVSYLITNLQSLIFVFDEPTIGLHEIEKQRLIQVIRKLVENQNTVIVVEHDKNFMAQADYIVEIGPGAGEYGGQLVFQGSYEKFLSCKDSVTSCYLNSSCRIQSSAKSRKVDLNDALKLENITIHNLQSVSAMIPLGVMVGIAGVSGSGKSSLISDALVSILKKNLQNRFVDLSEEEEEDSEEDIGLWNGDVQGIEKIEKCIIVDQKPIGRKSTSTPISYLGGLERIRKLLADTAYAKEHDYRKGLFSKNSEGRCLCCQGLGEIPIDIGLGNQLFLRCEDCAGTGYVPEALEVSYNGKNIHEIMQMSFEEAEAFFKQDKKLSALMTVMERVGMGYMKLGQKTTTISGGEAQRIKLAKELSQSTRGCLFILDEPTTGLSFRDTDHLMRLLNDIVDAGNSMIIIEHDTDVLQNCDYLIELGPGGGTAGGRIISAGTVEEIKRNPNSVIAKYL